MKLHLADGFTPPVELMTQKLAILARTGAGKTNTATVIAEEVLDAKQQVVVLDPKGDWWGLRSSADGQSAGYPIYVLGGDHADEGIALEATGGALIADVAAQGASLVLDLSTFSARDLRTFVTDFAERFYRAKAGHVSPVLVIFEEADEVVPQRVDNNNARMVGAIERLVKRGRFRGIGTLLVTQRSASLNKDVLTQTEVLIVQQTTSPQDKKAIDAWVEDHQDQEKRAELMANIASLKKGEAFVWSPTFLETFVRLRFRMRKTFDAGRDVKIGETRRAPKVLAPVDLTALGERMKATVEKAKAEDPRTLHARIRELERKLSDPSLIQRELARALPEPKVITKRVLEDGQLLRAEKLADRLVAIAGTYQDTLKKLHDSAIEIGAAIASTRSEAPPKARGSVGGAPVRVAAPATSLNRPSTAGHATGQAAQRPLTVRPREPRVTADGEAGLTSTHQAILNAALFLETVGFRTPGVPQLALTSGLSPTGGYWRTLVGRLRTLGLIDGTSLTKDGRNLAQSKPINGAQGVQDRVRRVLPSSTHQKVFDALIAAYPEGIGQDDEVVPRGGYGRTIIGRLRTLGVASKGWPLRAAPFLFLEEAA
jgi:hypothetical protein